MRDNRSIEEQGTHRLPRAAAWTLAILLAAIFIAAGLSKFVGPSAEAWAGRLEHWGYPPYARHVIGALEVLGGIGVLVPRVRRGGAGMLLALMFGALGTHAIHGELPRVVPPLVLGGLACLLYWSRRDG